MMKKLVGDLINEFDELDEDKQNVETFNKMFPNSRLGKWVFTIDGITEFEEYPRKWRVQIGEITREDNRIITLENKVQIEHSIRQIHPSGNKKSGRFTPITIDGVRFDGIRIASRSFGLSIDQFHRKFVKKQEGIYERRNNRTDLNTTVSNGEDD